MNPSQLWQHPIVKGCAAVLVFVVVSGFLISLMPLAWAGFAIPVTDRITIEMGDIPPWIVAFVAAGGLWKAWKAEKRATEAALAAQTAVFHIEIVRKQTDGVLDKISAMSKKAGQQQERAEVAAAKEIVRADAVADAESAAKVRSAENGDPPKPDGKA